MLVMTGAGIPREGMAEKMEEIEFPQVTVCYQSKYDLIPHYIIVNTGRIIGRGQYNLR
jgi:hypothetical protein